MFEYFRLVLVRPIFCIFFSVLLPRITYAVSVLIIAEFASPAPVANSAMMSTVTARRQWEDKTVRERTGHHPHMPRPRK